VICADSAHITVDEGGAPERMGGLGVSRPPTARLRSIAHIGVRTRDFAFAINGLAAKVNRFRCSTADRTTGAVSGLRAAPKAKAGCGAHSSTGLAHDARTSHSVK
jgi:threonine aldolase